MNVPSARGLLKAVTLDLSLQKREDADLWMEEGESTLRRKKHL